MKKVLSFILVLSMILGSFGMAFAATPSDVVGKNCAEAVNVLTELGVVEGYKDGSYKPEGIVTRAEMATLIVKALGLNDYAVGASKYSDMAGHWANGYVAYATSLGILSGFADGTFRPNQTVTYDQAITMIVQALGYSAECLTGTYPAAFVTKAKSLGITDDVQTGAAGANRGDVAIMLYNALDDYIGKVNKDGDWVASGTAANGVVEAKNADTMLKRLGATMEENYLVTGKEDSLINVYPIIGSYGTAYFTDDDELIGIASVDSVFLGGDIDLKEETFSGDDDVDYTIDGYLTKDSGYAVFENGEYKGTTTEAAVKDGVNISAKFSGKTIKKLYAVMSWKENNAAKVDKDDIALIEDEQELLGEDFKTLKNGDVDKDSFELLGVTSLDKISEDNVVAVYTNNKDKNSYITRVEVGTKVVTGEITKVRGTAKTTKYTIDGKEYKLSSLMGQKENESLQKFEAGDEVKLFLDYDGKIFDIDEIDSDSGNYAVVKNAATQSGYDWIIKIVLADGSSKTYTLDDEDEKIKVDGEKSDLTAKDLNAGDLIKYDLTKSGDLESIEQFTPKFKSSDKLSKKGVVGGKLVADNVIIFTVDSKGDYDVTTASKIDSDKNVGTGYYALNSKGKIAAMVVDESATGTTSSYGFIDGQSRIKNSDGDKVIQISGVIDGKAGEFATDKNTEYASYEQFAKLFTFEFSGEEITDVSETTLKGGDAIDDKLADGNAIFFEKDGAESEVMTKDGAVAYKVLGTDGDRIEITEKGWYEVVADATVYVPTFDSDDSFDSWKVSKVSSISKDGYVVLYQTDKDSDNWDTIVFIKKGDVEKWEKAISDK